MKFHLTNNREVEMVRWFDLLIMKEVQILPETKLIKEVYIHFLINQS